MDPLQQVPDEESLLELSTVPESQVEHLDSEGEAASFNADPRTTDRPNSPFILFYDRVAVSMATQT